MVLLLCLTSVGASALPLDKVIAVVNSEAITQTELQQQISIAKDQMQSAGMAIPNSAVLDKKILDQLITIKLQLQYAKKIHLVVSDKQLDQTIATIAAKNNMTVDQLKAGISQHGMTYPAYRKQIRQEMILAQLEHSQVGPLVKIMPQELKGLTNAQKQALFQQKYQAALAHWLIMLKSQAYIKRMS